MRDLELVPPLYFDDDEVGPCRGCVVGQRCGPDLLACAAFSRFVNGAVRAKWEGVTRKPTRERFERLCGRDDEAPQDRTRRRRRKDTDDPVSRDQARRLVVEALKAAQMP